MKVHKFVFTKQAKKDLNKLSPKISQQIEKKLKYFASTHDPLKLARPLVNLPPATHRFRFSKLRITFFIKNSVYYICSIKFRKSIYE